MFGTGWPSSGGGPVGRLAFGIALRASRGRTAFSGPVPDSGPHLGDLVPQMILSAKIPRWWNVTPSQMHWLGLHVRYAESLLAEAAIDPSLRAAVLETLSSQALRRVPAWSRKCSNWAMSRRGPKESRLRKMFVLAKEMVVRRKDSPVFRKRNSPPRGGAPDQVNYSAISRAFGTPKRPWPTPISRKLLNLRTFPTLMDTRAVSWPRAGNRTRLLGGPRGRSARSAVAAQRPHPGVDPAVWSGSSPHI